MNIGVWEDIVVSILSVNNFPITKAEGLREGLQQYGLCDPRSLSECGLDEVATALLDAGYDRSLFMRQLLGERLLCLGLWAKQSGWQKAESILLAAEVGANQEKLLQEIKGVGPQVLQTFFITGNRR